MSHQTLIWGSNFFPEPDLLLFFGIAQCLLRFLSWLEVLGNLSWSLSFPRVFLCLLVRTRACGNSRKAWEEWRYTILAELTSTLFLPPFFQWVLLCCPDWPQTPLCFSTEMPRSVLRLNIRHFHVYLPDDLVGSLSSGLHPLCPGKGFNWCLCLEKPCKMGTCLVSLASQLTY